MWILTDIPTLAQYLAKLKQESCLFDKGCCPHCGYATLWKHAWYYRKSDRINPAQCSINLIPIQRFLCPACHKTCSALPECIPPRRWYVWGVQQAALLLVLGGKSIYAAAKESIPSRHTISRWMTRSREQFTKHKITLCQHLSDWGRTTDFIDFWKSCFNRLSLAQAMRLCHVAGVAIP